MKYSKPYWPKIESIRPDMRDFYGKGKLFAISRGKMWGCDYIHLTENEAKKVVKELTAMLKEIE